jgi:hypothetical protein
MNYLWHTLWVVVSQINVYNGLYDLQPPPKTALTHDGCVTVTSAAPAKKRVAVFLDGTWNAVNDNTNVWRLKSLLASAGRDGLQQLPTCSGTLAVTR